jgi:serine/threonine protein kinase
MQPDPTRSKKSEEVQPKSADPFVGTVCGGRYEVMQRIGLGGWSTVYKARDQLLDRVVALKLLHPNLSSDPARTNRFHREAMAAAALQHPNITPVYDFQSLPGGQPFIVMELLNGPPLSKTLAEDGAMDVARAVETFVPLVDALALAHAQGIIHRDLKPSNIGLHVMPDGRVVPKILDFGVAKLLDRVGTAGTELTSTGEQLGTVEYMSPEQCKGFPADRRSDVYSLGCIMYETLTAKKAFAAPTTVACMYKQINEAAAPFSEVTGKKAFPPRLEALVFRCLEKDPERRFASMDDVQAELLRVRNDLGVGGSKSVTARLFKARSGLAIPSGGVFLAAAFLIGLAAVSVSFNYLSHLSLSGAATAVRHQPPAVEKQPPHMETKHAGPQKLLARNFFAMPGANVEKGSIGARISEAEHLLDSGDLSQAQQTAQSVLDLLSGMAPSSQEAVARIIIAQSLVEQSDWKGAEPEARQAIYLFKKFGDFDQLQCAYPVLAQILVESDRPGEAIAELSKGLQAGSQTQTPKLDWRHLSEQHLIAAAQSLIAQKQFAAAATALESNLKTVSNSAAVGDRDFLIDYYEHLAAAFEGAGRKKEALQYKSEAGKLNHRS